jgi:hypothetical protein
MKDFWKDDICLACVWNLRLVIIYRVITIISWRILVSFRGLCFWRFYSFAWWNIFEFSSFFSVCLKSPFNVNGKATQCDTEPHCFLINFEVPTYLWIVRMENLPTWKEASLSSRVVTICLPYLLGASSHPSSTSCIRTCSESMAAASSSSFPFGVHSRSLLLSLITLAITLELPRLSKLAKALRLVLITDGLQPIPGHNQHHLHLQPARQVARISLFIHMQNGDETLNPKT